MTICLIFGFLVLSYISYRLYQHFVPAPNINPNGKYVLISGCDTGFGHALAIELDKQGVNVLAGVLLPDNVTTLKNKLSSKATVFQLDITKQADIDAAYDLVNSKSNSLHALVNNAGIATSGYIDWTSMEMTRKVMDVNFFGHVAMTKKLLPLLITRRDSRVVNICSVAGFISSPSAFAYCASKYALESFSDCLRREMFTWGLRVSIIEPGFMRTPIVDSIMKPFADVWSTIPKDMQERWGEGFVKNLLDEAEKNIFLTHAEDPMKVVRTLEHAVISTAPRIRYRPGWQSSIILLPMSMLPAGIVDWIISNLSKLKVLPAGVSKQRRD